MPTYMTFIETSDIMREATNPRVAPTDLKSVLYMFRTGAVPRTLWNTCDFTLPFKCRLIYRAVAVNKTAKVLFRKKLSYGEDMDQNPQQHTLELTTTSRHVVEEVAECVAYKGLLPLKRNTTEFIRIEINSTAYVVVGFREVASLGGKQESIGSRKT